MALFTRPRLRAVAILAGALFVGFIGLQFVRPTLMNPPVLADLQAPAPIKQILRTSCYNCHSNETKLPWYDQIVPAYWLVVHDVNEGREHLNFSDFDKMPVAQQKAFLFESVSQIQLGAMPPRKYTFVHPEAIITPEQLAALKNYLYPNDEAKPTDAAVTAAADAQYQQWIASGAAPKNVQPTLNGIAFFSDYRDWKPVSTTDRYDNGTFRVILGNEVTTKAIAENKIHPWPEGAAFAKIAWAQQADDKGSIKPGQFLQVEFMIKDSTKYASTHGWGFARWKTENFVPYGKTSTFANECMSCHLPMENNDFVFSMPIKAHLEAPDLYNNDAALPGDLPYDPFQWRVITTSRDKPSGTMSTLYGNDLAVTHARTSSQGAYSAGAILALVTWHQQEDQHWFGGRIPGKVQSVEFVTVQPAGADGKPVYVYEAYEGSLLKKTTGVDAVFTQPKVDAILGQRASVMP